MVRGKVFLSLQLADKKQIGKNWENRATKTISWSAVQCFTEREIVSLIALDKHIIDLHG